MIVLRKKIASYPLNTRARCAQGGPGNQKTLRTGHTRKYRPSSGLWIPFKSDLLLHRYGAM